MTASHHQKRFEISFPTIMLARSAADFSFPEPWQWGHCGMPQLAQTHYGSQCWETKRILWHHPSLYLRSYDVTLTLWISSTFLGYTCWRFSYVYATKSRAWHCRDAQLSGSWLVTRKGYMLLTFFFVHACFAQCCNSLIVVAVLFLASAWLAADPFPACSAAEQTHSPS